MSAAADHDRRYMRCASAFLLPCNHRPRMIIFIGRSQLISAETPWASDSYLHAGMKVAPHHGASCGCSCSSYDL